MIGWQFGIKFYLNIYFFEFLKSSNSDILYIYNFYCVLLCEECHIILSYLEPIYNLGF